MSEQAVRLTPEMLAAWPNCATVDCCNKRCLWSGTPLCFPCAVDALGADEMARTYNATHPDCNPMSAAEAAKAGRTK